MSEEEQPAVPEPATPEISPFQDPELEPFEKGIDPPDVEYRDD